MAEPFEPVIEPGTPLLAPEPAGAFHANPEEELRAKIRLSWANQNLQRALIQPPPDPGYRPWTDMKGYEPYASTLSRSRSKTETDALKRLIDNNKRDQQTAASGELGLLGDLVAGVFDPVNLVPLPWVKGIGLVRGALYTSAAFGALSAGTEIARINADPTAQWSEMPGNIAMASLLGGIIGAPVGMWGARAARAERAIRAFEADIGNVDSPFHSLRPRSQPGLRFESGRPARAADGTYPLFAQAEEVIGYEPKTVDGVTYVSEDGLNWTTAAEEGRAGPLAVSDDIAEHLGTPVPITELVQKGDEVRVKAEFNKGEWHDEVQSYIEGNANVRHVVRDANDYYNFRHYQHIYERSLPRLAGETAEAWRQRVGTEAMREYRGSQQGGDYAGFLAQMLGRMNFSPVIKAIRLARGDNRVADLSLRIGGDYKWAIEGNQTRWSTPPSLILNAMRQHTPRYHRFLNEFEAEWVKYASGNQDYGGRSFQGLNVSAAAYKLKRGLRRGGGAQGMTHADFEEMVAEAVFNPNDFEVRGFPVNENARNAAKAFIRMAQEYDDLLRASGAFRDQKNLTRDLKHWNRQIVYHQNRVMEWLWGREGRPANLQHAIRTGRGPAATPAPAARMKRLYTFQPENRPVAEVADWIKESPEYKAQMEASGRWYTETIDEAEWYIREHPEGRLGYVDVPEQLAETLRVGSYVGDLDPARFSARPDLEFFVTRAIADQVKPFVKPGGERIFTGTSHDEAIQNMMDALGDEGIALSENLTADNYGYTYHEGPQPQAALTTSNLTADPAYRNFTTVGEALDHLMRVNEDADLSALAKKLRGDVADIPFRVVEAGEAVRPNTQNFLDQGALGVYDPVDRDIHVAGGSLDPNGSGANTEVVLHEAFHGASHNRIEMGLTDIRDGLRNTPHAKAVLELSEVQSRIRPERNFDKLDLTEAEKKTLNRQLDIAGQDVHELVSYGLTSPLFRRYLESIPYDGKISMWQRIWEILGKLFGVKPKSGQLRKLMEINDRLMKTKQAQFGPASGEYFIPSSKAMAGPNQVGEGFTLSKDAPGLLDTQHDRYPAIQFDGQIITAGDHATAIELAIEKWGDDFYYDFEENPEAYLGYYRRPQPKAMEGPPSRLNRPANEDIPGGPISGTPSLGAPANIGEAVHRVRTMYEEYSALLSKRDLQRRLDDPAVDELEKQIVQKILDERTQRSKVRAAEMLGLDPEDLQDIRPQPKAMEGPKPSDTGRFISIDDFNKLEGAAAEQAHGNAAIFWDGQVFQEGDEHADVLANFLRDHPEARAEIEANPGKYMGFVYRDAMEGGPAAIDAGPAFVTVDDALDQRVRRLTPAQRAIYDERAGGLAAAQESLAKTQADLKTVTEMPHQFLDANGKSEPWFHRVWDKSKGATEREQLTRLITKWFERDNPSGARQRAELAIDNILNDSAEIADTGTLGMSPLRQRTLNVPNSWSIEDPQFGTLKISDFIDKRITAIAEHYSKRAGVIVESAKMFGPGGIRQAFAEQREYLMSTYWEKASDADKPGVLEWINEIEGEQQLAYDTVAGTLRTVDPQRVDNRISRLFQSLSTLGVMGKVAFASIPEILRPGMVNGFGTQFNVILQKYIGDLELLRGNTELNELTGELFDLASKQMHIQAVTIQDGEPTLGGTWLENLINDQVPNLYKISGLTSLTTWQKTIAGLAAQHSVMSQAIDVGEALRAGLVPDPKAVLRLNAMGINVRDALLLSEMPVEHYQGGKLILPAVDGWGSKANGRRAREILLNGIHAEMRRTIVTPSVGDRSTIFNGVWTHKGEKVFESDIMTIPMQFLSYGMGAHNAMLISGLQGRDHTLVLGMFYALLMGMFAEWFRTDSKVWMNKGYDEMIADGFDASGIGGFWFSNLNTQIERASSGKFGLRPLAGIKTDFDKKTPGQGVASAFGVAPGYFYDISRAFWDSSVTATERAQLIRKAIPYNNVVWWERIFREMAAGAGGAFEGARK